MDCCGDDRQKFRDSALLQWTCETSGVLSINIDFEVKSLSSCKAEAT